MSVVGKKSSSIFVQNLKYDVTEEQLKKHFQDCGVVQYSEICKREDGKPKGYGYVTFSTLEAAEKALRKHETTLNGRFIDVRYPYKEEADPSKSRAASLTAPNDSNEKVKSKKSSKRHHRHHHSTSSDSDSESEPPREKKSKKSQKKKDSKKDRKKDYSSSSSEEIVKFKHKRHDESSSSSS